MDSKRENLQSDGADPTHDSNGCERNGSLKRQQDSHSAERPTKKCRTESDPPVHPEMDSSEVKENWTADAGHIWTPVHTTMDSSEVRAELPRQDRVRPSVCAETDSSKVDLLKWDRLGLPVYAIMDSSEITEHLWCRTDINSPVSGLSWGVKNTELMTEQKPKAIPNLNKTGVWFILQILIVGFCHNPKFAVDEMLLSVVWFYTERLSYLYRNLPDYFFTAQIYLYFVSETLCRWVTR